MGDGFSIESALRLGTLPGVRQRQDYAEEILRAYVRTYLSEEIKQEALVEDLGAFTRFLAVAGLFNGTIPNFSNAARDCGVARKTVERYFEVLVDTLIGFFLPAWQPRLKVREIASPKFYLFDCGVCRGLIGIEPSLDERAVLFETYFLHELRAYQNLLKVPGQLSYWRSGAGAEIHFVWSLGETHIGIEVKSSTDWRPSYARALKDALQQNGIKKAYGVYLGTRCLLDEEIEILPFFDFVQRLYKGEILRAGEP